MSSLQRRIAAIANTTANLIDQSRKLDRLRERLRKAQISAQGSRRLEENRGALPEFKIELSCRLKPALVGEPSVIRYGSFSIVAATVGLSELLAGKTSVGSFTELKA
jgi:hypothetical protein